MFSWRMRALSGEKSLSIEVPSVFMTSNAAVLNVNNPPSERKYAFTAAGTTFESAILSITVSRATLVAISLIIGDKAKFRLDIERLVTDGTAYSCAMRVGDGVWYWLSTSTASK